MTHGERFGTLGVSTAGEPCAARDCPTELLPGRFRTRRGDSWRLCREHRDLLRNAGELVESDPATPSRARSTPCRATRRNDPTPTEPPMTATPSLITPEGACRAGARCVMPGAAKRKTRGLHGSCYAIARRDGWLEEVAEAPKYAAAPPAPAAPSAHRLASERDAEQAIAVPSPILPCPPELLASADDRPGTLGCPKCGAIVKWGCGAATGDTGSAHCERSRHATARGPVVPGGLASGACDWRGSVIRLPSGEVMLEQDAKALGPVTSPALDKAIRGVMHLRLPGETFPEKVCALLDLVGNTREALDGGAAPAATLPELVGALGQRYAKATDEIDAIAALFPGMIPEGRTLVEHIRLIHNDRRDRMAMVVAAEHDLLNAVGETDGRLYVSEGLDLPACVRRVAERLTEARADADARANRLRLAQEAVERAMPDVSRDLPLHEAIDRLADTLGAREEDVWTALGNPADVSGWAALLDLIRMMHHAVGRIRTTLDRNEAPKGETLADRFDTYVWNVGLPLWQALGEPEGSWPLLRLTTEAAKRIAAPAPAPSSPSLLDLDALERDARARLDAILQIKALVPVARGRAA